MAESTGYNPWSRLIPKDLTGGIRSMLRDASKSVRQSAYQVGRGTPVYRMGSAPFYMSSARARSRTYRGLKHIFGTATRSGAGGRYMALERAIGASRPRDLIRLQRLAYFAGGSIERGGMPTRKLLKEASGIVGADWKGTSFGRVGGKVKDIFAGPGATTLIPRTGGTRGMIRSFLSGTGGKGIFKAYQHAIVNPRNVAIAGAGYLAARAAGAAMRYGENYYTENVSRGRFGTDTAGILGPAAIKGMRFQIMRRRRTL